MELGTWVPWLAPDPPNACSHPVVQIVRVCGLAAAVREVCVFGGGSAALKRAQQVGPHPFARLALFPSGARLIERDMSVQGFHCFAHAMPSAVLLLPLLLTQHLNHLLVPGAGLLQTTGSSAACHHSRRPSRPRPSPQSSMRGTSTGCASMGVRCRRWQSRWGRAGAVFPPSPSFLRVPFFPA